MYIVKYFYFERRIDPLTGNGSFDPDRRQNPIFKQCAGNSLRGTMAAYRQGDHDHDLSRYTPRTIYDVINTEE